MSEFKLEAFSAEADILNKGLGRNIPNIKNPFTGSSLDPNTSHSIWNASTWSNALGMGGGDDGGGSAADAESAYQAWLRNERKKAKAKVEETFAPYGLDDDAFAYGDPVRRKHMKYVMDSPITGIKAQRRAAADDLAAALERQGLTKSSTAVRRDALMDKTFAKAQVDAAAGGDTQAMNLRGALMKAKADALDRINLSSDPASVASSAMTQANIASDPGKFEPMYDVFDKITKGLLLRQEVENRKRQREFFQNYFPQSSSQRIISGD